MERYTIIGDFCDSEEKEIALKLFLEEWEVRDGIIYEAGTEDEILQDNIYGIDDYSDDNKYRVLTDYEADEAEDQYLDNYIDECVLEGKSGTLAAYFDRDAFKKDARMDGRGHSLSSYDGEENEIEINGTMYFIYRQ